MTLSFIIIAYNEERNIARTVNAILAQKDVPDHEIIVVNDGSKDRTLTILNALAVKNKAVKVVDLGTNQGRGAARAAGVKAAKGRYFAFVDADIVLPSDWFSRCLPFMKEYDACGGTAVPDGDVAFVHALLRLVPKVAPHTTTVTGSNGLFKREVFDKVAFNPQKKNGEDVDLGYKIAAAQFKTVTVPGLLVEHNEHKTYLESLNWLFTSGLGASRQFYEHKEVRLPDLAFFGFVGLLLVSLIGVLAAAIPMALVFAALFAYVSASSLMHLHGKFELARTPLKSLAGLLVNDTLLLAYYLGRCVGMASEWKTTA